jgi:phage shock protein E
MKNGSKTSRRVTPAVVAALVLFASGCGGDDEAGTPAVAESVVETSGVADAPATSNLTLIDVRDVEEFATGHLPNATNIPFNDGTLAAQIPSLDPNGAYGVYCRSGNRSGQAVALMKDAGFTNVVDLGGLEAAFSATGLELVTN